MPGGQGRSAARPRPLTVPALPPPVGRSAIALRSADRSLPRRSASPGPDRRRVHRHLVRARLARLPTPQPHRRCLRMTRRAGPHSRPDSLRAGNAPFPASRSAATRGLVAGMPAAFPDPGPPLGGPAGTGGGRRCTGGCGFCKTWRCGSRAGGESSSHEAPLEKGGRGCQCPRRKCPLETGASPGALARPAAESCKRIRNAAKRGVRPEAACAGSAEAAAVPPRALPFAEARMPERNRALAERGARRESAPWKHSGRPAAFRPSRGLVRAPPGRSGRGAWLRGPAS